MRSDLAGLIGLALLASCAAQRSTTTCTPAASHSAPVMRCVAAAPVLAEPPAPEPEPAPEPAPEPKAELTTDKIELREKVNFETGSATLVGASQTLLDEVVTILNEHPEIKRVRIEGHTDDRGDARSNQRLSEARAAAVRTYLVDKGVAAGRMESKGFGESKPVADNATSDGQDQNRRVEIYIVERAP